MKVDKTETKEPDGKLSKENKKDELKVVENNDTANPQTQANPPEQPQRGQLSIFKILFGYFVINQIISFFYQATPKSNPNLFSNVYNNDEPLEVRFIISKKALLYSFENNSNILRNWTERDIFYNFEPSNMREKILFFNKSELIGIKNLYMHIYVHSIRNLTNITNSDHITYLMLEETFDLIDYREKVEKKEEKSLLFDSFEENSYPKKEEKKKKGEMKPHLRTLNYISLVHDTNYYAKNQIPPQINLTLIDNLKIFQPIIDTKQFWVRKKEYIPLEETYEQEQFNITVNFNVYWSWKYMLEVQMSMSNQMQESFGFETNMDDVKEMVLDTNVYLFSITMIVSLLHTLFEFLAIKNDIQFWRNIESHKGLSLRTFYLNFIIEIIVLLYLFDEETSTIILVSSVINILVTVWKIMKTTKFKLRADKKFPWIEFDHKDSYKGETEEFDKQASRYLFYLMIPFFICYVIYALIYEKFKSWYSFVLHTLVGFIYLFGFIQMTPQLYINYKLKSVEHLPWRTMIYNF